MIVSSVISRPVQVSVLSNTYAVNIAALKAIDISEMAGNTQISVAGYYTPGDGGGGTFYYDAEASDTDNGGSVIAPTAGSGRWKRVWDEETLTLPMFGIFPHATTNQTVAIQAVIDLAASMNVDLYVPAGTYRVINLLIRAGTYLRGAGRATVFKLPDNSVNWNMVLRTESGTDDVDGVILRDFVVDGNQAQIGLTDSQMHGIAIYGGHEDWIFENILTQYTCGDGIYIGTNTSSIPKNIKLYNIHAIGCSRQDISIVNVDGISVINCTGTGKFDIEANPGTDVCKNITLSNLRYDTINVGPLGEYNGVVNNVVGSSLNANNEVFIWGVATGAFSGLCAPSIDISRCNGVSVSSVKCEGMQVRAANDTFCKHVSVSDVEIISSADNKIGLELYNAQNCTFRNFHITLTGASAIGVKRSNQSSPQDVTIFENFTISHTYYGLYVTPQSGESGCKVIFNDITILTAGTNPIQITTGLASGYGTFIFRNIDVIGAPSIAKFYKVEIDGMVVRGDYNMSVNYMAASGGSYLDIDRLKFKRDTAGTTTLSMTNSTSIAGLSIGKVEQLPTGSFTLAMGTPTFESGVKAWINGPVVESTSWASSLADANIKEGSMYRLRGNATNWGYTHNGTAWVAKAH